MPDCSSVCIDLMGANLVSWKKPDGRELLYSSNVDDYGFMGGTLGRYSGEKTSQPRSNDVMWQHVIYFFSLAARGGVILAFPQFGEGSLGRDGFLKDVEWELVGSVSASLNDHLLLVDACFQ